MTALHALSLADAVARLRAGSLTARHYAEALLARIAATDAAIGAWACLDPAHVRREAERCDAQPPGARGVLHGAGLGVKDIVDTRALPTRMGSPAFDTYVPPGDAACIEALHAAGGYVLGKTVTTETAFLHPGATRNPWNAVHTPGGSSQGSAAAVAAGQVPAAIGTQTNGSVLRPAAFCGVVGFKPSLGAIDYRGAHLFSATLDTLGSFARSVPDAALAAHALAPGCLPAAPPACARAPRIAFLPAFPWTQVDADMAGALDAAAATLGRAGARIVAVALPDALELAAAVHRAIMLGEAARTLAPLRARAEGLLSATLRAALDEGAHVSEADLAQSRAARAAMIACARDWLGHFDALLVPSAPGAAPRGLHATGDPACCTLASLLGAPALSLPVGLNAARLPLGAQLVAAPGADEALLAVAAWCEARLPFAGLASTDLPPAPLSGA